MLPCRTCRVLVVDGGASMRCALLVRGAAQVLGGMGVWGFGGLDAVINVDNFYTWNWAAITVRGKDLWHFSPTYHCNCHRRSLLLNRSVYRAIDTKASPTSTFSLP